MKNIAMDRSTLALIQKAPATSKAIIGWIRTRIDIAGSIFKFSVQSENDANAQLLAIQALRDLADDLALCIPDEDTDQEGDLR